MGTDGEVHTPTDIMVKCFGDNVHADSEDDDKEDYVAFHAVAFDVGGVLTTGGSSVWGELAERLGLSEYDLLEAFYFDPIAKQLWIGQATREEALASVSRQLSLSSAEVGDILAARRASRTWDTELLAFIRALRPRYRTGVISNAAVGARERLQRYVNDDTFDVIVLSAEEGMAKPEPEIYERSLERLGVAAEETIFVDDLRPNVEGARVVGMHGILYTDSVDMRNRISHLLDT